MDGTSMKNWRLARLRAFGAAGFLVVALLGAFAGSALAGPESGVDIVVHDGDAETTAQGNPPTACTFHLHFQAGTAISGAFQVRAGDDDGDVVADGLFDTASGDSRAPASGVFELDPGSYVVTWDDETEQDRSFDEQAVVVACEAPVDSGSQPPAPSGEELPAASGEELPAEGSGEELPAGGVGGITTTPPPTDAVAPTAGSSDLRPALALLMGIGGLGLFLTRRQRRDILVGRATINRS
ncbi:MAG TPA: hypothetical protein VFO73_03780 [Candidatus Limnocylindrales bacterium]|nr:hypothetical protein [Candidatus Limnocylindrales bacterium]